MRALTIQERNELQDLRDYADRIGSLPDCNTCSRSHSCAHAQAIGQTVRINCPLWAPEQERGRVNIMEALMITERDAIQCLVKMAQKAKRNLDNVKSTATEEERKSLLLKYETLSWAVGCCINDMKFNSD